MSKLKLEVTENPSPDDVMAIEDGLGTSVPKGVEPRNYRPLAIFVRNSEGEIAGGLEGSTYWSWLNIRLLWISDELRGQGFGKQLVEAAEKCAALRGCHGAVVDTFSFQATDFYKKLGYEVFGTLDDFPKGERRYYMRKDKIQ